VTEFAVVDYSLGDLIMIRSNSCRRLVDPKVIIALVVIAQNCNLYVDGLVVR